MNNVERVGTTTRDARMPGDNCEDRYRNWAIGDALSDIRYHLSEVVRHIGAAREPVGGALHHLSRVLRYLETIQAQVGPEEIR